MSPEEINRILIERFGDRVRPGGLDTAHPHATVEGSGWREVAAFLRDDERLGFSWLRCISSVDLVDEGKLAAVYDLHAMDRPAGFSPESAARLSPVAGKPWRERHTFAVKVVVSRERPHIPSVADIWPAAEWHEREAYDMMGIVFDGHPNLARILCPDDWVGHPLRKDYEFPTSYEGIPDPAGEAAASKATEE
ncbi:MAG: NADH-quinone oxidoreductase subunit C [Phycisphaerae bacterium]|nr:NADH-quinone oxidoreductase subunit C [Phycisphaerae bacterium]